MDTSKIGNRAATNQCQSQDSYRPAYFQCSLSCTLYRANDVQPRKTKPSALGRPPPAAIRKWPAEPWRDPGAVPRYSGGFERPGHAVWARHQMMGAGHSLSGKANSHWVDCIPKVGGLRPRDLNQRDHTTGKDWEEWLSFSNVNHQGCKRLHHITRRDG